MKKFIYYIGILALCLLPAACSLEEESNTEVEKNKYMNNAKEAQDVLLGVYRSTIEDGMYGYNLSIYFSMGTDLSQVEGSSTENFRILPTNAYPTSQAEVQSSWSSLYSGIYNANDFLERVSVKMESYNEADKRLATIYIAEARALRALYYFELVRRWGNIPLMTSTAMSDQHPSTFVQADPVDVYKFIEEDLLYACDILPYSTEPDYRSDNSYRFSKGAALGLLTKVYATWAGYPLQDASKWEAAAKTARILVESGKHDLLDDYTQLWRNTCNGIWNPEESLIEVSFYSPTYSGGSDPVGRIGKWNGVKTTVQAGKSGSCAANVQVVHSFVLDWRTDAEPNPENGISPDRRQNISIANYKHGHNDNKNNIVYKGDFYLAASIPADNAATALSKDLDPEKSQKAKQTYTPAKWDIDRYMENIPFINNDKSTVNWYVLRYADVLLLYAEALNEWKGGPTTDAYAAINKVRKRGYGNTGNYQLPEGMDQTDFRKAIQKERAYELAFEGHRRLDLVRWGIYYETIQETYDKLVDWWIPTNDLPKPNYVVYDYTEKGKHELMPIPQREMDLCSQFKQNPKW
ncbi:RagB/SusD family nutrient uptake outer membrane protein [uncultured Bacteroides sp.]|uniref:RagB/SusD family nutrient uptake outer membrane protein n=1 Tax=uncultured Bacteroides sp. TaxID=162156 RepID=UPI0025E68438|nr:RagB/SusD family nutrient uptake outer membrane protein [uncultured Bacteroides sp.]